MSSQILHVVLDQLAIVKFEQYADESLLLSLNIFIHVVLELEDGEDLIDGLHVEAMAARLVFSIRCSLKFLLEHADLKEDVLAYPTHVDHLD